MGGWVGWADRNTPTTLRESQLVVKAPSYVPGWKCYPQIVTPAQCVHNIIKIQLEQIRQPTQRFFTLRHRCNGKVKHRRVGEQIKCNSYLAVFVEHHFASQVCGSGQCPTSLIPEFLPQYGGADGFLFLSFF